MHLVYMAQFSDNSEPQMSQPSSLIVEGWVEGESRVVNRKGKWNTLQAGNSEPSNASTHAAASIYWNVVGGGGGGGGGIEKGKGRWILGTLHIPAVPDCTTVSTQCEACPSCSTSTALASVITAIATALLTTVISVLVMIAVCKCHPKFTPGGAETATSAGGEGQEYEEVDGGGAGAAVSDPNYMEVDGGGGGENTFQLKENEASGDTNAFQLKENEAYDETGPFQLREDEAYDETSPFQFRENEAYGEILLKENIN